MSDEPSDELGMIIRPREVSILLADDRLSVVLWMKDQDGRPVSILLPLSAVLTLRDQLAEILGNPPAPADRTPRKSRPH